MSGKIERRFKYPEAVVQTQLSETDLDKFKRWGPNARIELWPCGKNELIIINHSILEADKNKKPKQTAQTEALFG